MVGEDPSFGPVVVVMTREREVRSKSYWFLLLTQYVRNLSLSLFSLLFVSFLFLSSLSPSFL